MDLSQSKIAKNGSESKPREDLGALAVANEGKNMNLKTFIDSK